jgi:hypothetical protein
MTTSPKMQNQRSKPRAGRIVRRTEFRRTWPDILPICETCNIRNGALTCTQPVHTASLRRAACNTQRSNAIGVAERYDAEACEHRNARVRAMSLVHELAHGYEYVLLIDTEFPGVIQIVGKDIEEQL